MIHFLVLSSDLRGGSKYLLDFGLCVCTHVCVCVLRGEGEGGREGGEGEGGREGGEGEGGNEDRKLKDSHWIQEFAH